IEANDERADDVGDQCPPGKAGPGKLDRCCGDQRPGDTADRGAQGNGQVQQEPVAHCPPSGTLSPCPSHKPLSPAASRAAAMPTAAAPRQTASARTTLHAPHTHSPPRPRGTSVT